LNKISMLIFTNPYIATTEQQGCTYLLEYQQTNFLYIHWETHISNTYLIVTTVLVMKQTLGKNKTLQRLEQSIGKDWNRALTETGTHHGQDWNRELAKTGTEH